MHLLVNQNVPAGLADYCSLRERELTSLPDRYPHSLFADSALNDAYTYGHGAAFLGVLGARAQPERALAYQDEKGTWRCSGISESARVLEVARRLADRYPDSPYAPAALLRVAQAEAQGLDPEKGRATYRRLLLDTPGRSRPRRRWTRSSAWRGTRGAWTRRAISNRPRL